MQLISDISNDWRELQQRVGKILLDCGFEVEVEKTIDTIRGTVEIDVYAKDVTSMPISIYVCECKNWSTAVPQEKVHALYTVVQNTGANHGLLISKNGFQAGAYAASESTNIKLLSWLEFTELFKERWIKAKINYLHNLSEELFDFTDYISSKYNKEFLALEETDREVYREMMDYYSEIVVRCSKFMFEHNPIDLSIAEKSKIFDKKFSSYDEYFELLEMKCKEGIERFRKLLFHNKNI